MATLYITSTQTFSGKSTLCVGLARRLQRDGLRIGYMKPISTGARLTTALVDEDAALFKAMFALPDSPDDMVPIRLGPQALEALLGGQQSDLAATLQDAYVRVAQGRDVVILEGGCNLREGTLIGLPAGQVATLLGACALAVVRYDDDVQLLDDALTAQRSLGECMLGVVLNSIPRQRMPFVQELVKPALERRGLAVLAIFPQERLLQSISVGELVELLSGEVLTGQGKMDELVEHLMVGAMGVDSALAHFRRKPNKAVITGGDRSDIQLAALETSTKCLILTGSLRPSPIILGRAEEVGVPMILVRQDTMAAVEAVEHAFGKTHFHQEKKIERIEEMLADRFDLNRLYTALGIANKTSGG